MAVTTGASLEDRIAALDVSDNWKERFRDIARLRRVMGVGRAAYRNVDQETRKTAFTINFVAFLFGPVYYFFKGMHRRGLVGVGAVFVFLGAASLIEAGLDVTFPTAFYWVPGSSLAGLYANPDFFDTRVEGLHMWPALKRLDSWFASWASAIVGVVAGLLIIINTVEAGISEIESILERELGELVEFDVEVVCPEDAPVREGGAFVCVAYVEGESALVEVTMTSDTEFLWEVPDPARP